MDDATGADGGQWGPDPAAIYFSDYFGVHPDTLVEFGALDISLVADMPLFIDPFLLFNSEDTAYLALHNQILEYLRFLRDRAGDRLDMGLIHSLYAFKEVKQNWLGFTRDGNSGHGLGRSFATSLHQALGDVLSNLGSETVTRSSHVEKVALIQPGVGRDNISDFTTNLIKHHLLTFTATFAKNHLRPDQTRDVTVQRAAFNYKTGTWAARSYCLPWVDGGIDESGNDLPGDYVILSPLDLLTRDDTWINRSDMIGRLEQIALALPDEQLRAQVNDYLGRQMGANPDRKAIDKARSLTVAQFPELVDYYIALKEEHQDEASASSLEKTRDTQYLFRDRVQAAAHDIAAKTDLYDRPWTSYDEAKTAVETFKHYVEHQDGYTLINRGRGRAFSSEKEVQTFFGLLLQPSRFDVNREPNNCRGPVDFKRGCCTDL
ncbi:hypothetical protein [Cryptosporangium sp. NPDC048952]|uniref:hypothetical protein n=1 Tax=Cryptosporangium sp. NPDC048952 TaxID=3363961 RepID=UPI00371CF1C4